MMMSKAFAIAAAVALLCPGSLAQADVFNLGTGFTNLETVAVGDPGNAGEISGVAPFARVCGAVSYNYRIGKYEVTAKQYTDFLNNKAKCDGDPYGLYHMYMGDPSATVYEFFWGCNIQRSGGGTVANPYVYTVADDWANRPVNYVSYWDSCRFANWLGNGQGNGDTETGAYALNGYNGIDGGTIQRNAGAKWAVTSEDEWYKAAYYKGGGTNAGYWDYPMQSDIPTTPSNARTNPDGGNNANFNTMYGGGYKRTNVGEFENSESAYGTFDQCGNVCEWNETLVYDGSGRGLRGGSFADFYVESLQASRRDGSDPTFEGYSRGFRVSDMSGILVTDDGAHTTNPARLHATWEICLVTYSEYEYAIGTSPENLIVDWKSVGTDMEATETGLSLEVGRKYYWYVKGREPAGPWSQSFQSDGITVVLPSAPMVNDDGIYTGNLTDLHSTWSASDPWGIVDYQYAIGTSPSSLIMDWKSVGTATGATETGLSLQLDQEYYFYVKAKNGGGLWSLAGASDGIKAAATCPIGEARAPRVGTAVYLPGSVVTSSTTDFAGFWVESQDRSSATKVNSSWSAARGDRLDLAGIVSWTDGTPVLTNPELKGQISGPPLAPPGLTHKALANDEQESLNYVGLNPVGLLAVTWGKVTRVNTALHVFYINDGSELADGMGPSDYPYVGLRVAYKTGMTSPAVNKIVRVVGIRTVEKTTLVYDAFVNGEYRFAEETLYLPVLTLRDQADITVLK